MKRFFLVFSILLTVFLVLTAGSIAALEYGSIQTYKLPPPFYGDWGITAIPFRGSQVIYPNGDVFVVKKAPASQIAAGNVILFVVSDGSGIMSGFVTGNAADGLNVIGADGKAASVPAGNLVGKYESRIPDLAEIIGLLQSPVAIGALAAVLLASILLWRKLPGKNCESAELGAHDADIASLLY